MHAPSFDCAFTRAEDLRACRGLLRDGSRTFYAASFLLPQRVREPAIALYAFCRQADDAVDIGRDPLSAIGDLRERLRLAYSGCPQNFSADRAFAHVVREFSVPNELPLALIEGFEWDVQSRRYDSFDELTDYAVRVAGTVGAMMALIMGVRERQALERACDLGVAMQLTNIARDVGEDVRAGRLYLPLAWLREAGVDPAQFLAKPCFNEAIASVIKRLLDQADHLYQRATAGIAELPANCRPGILAARSLYAEIGREVARNGYDSVSSRAVVPVARKAAVIAGMRSAEFSNGGTCVAPVGDAAAAMLEAVKPLPQARAVETVPASTGIGERAVWIVDLFERLGRREQVELRP